MARPSPLPPGRPETNGSNSRSRISGRNPGPVVPHLQPHRVVQVGAVGNVGPLHRAPTLTVIRIGPRAACTALRTRLASTRCSRSSSPSMMVRPPSTVMHRVGPAVGVRPDQPDHGHDHRVEIERHELGGPHPGEVEELAQQPAQPVALPDDEAGEEALVVVGVLGAGELLDRAPDRGQRVPDLVGQRGAQRRHRLQPLGAGLELLHFLQVGDVGEDGGHRRRLLGLLTERGGAEADGEDAPAVVGHHALAAADLPAVPDPGHDRRPELRGAGLELVQHRQADQPLAVEVEQLLRRSG